jgi:hypothetical protein
MALPVVLALRPISKSNHKRKRSQTPDLTFGKLSKEEELFIKSSSENTRAPTNLEVSKARKRRITEVENELIMKLIRKAKSSGISNIELLETIRLVSKTYE